VKLAWTGWSTPVVFPSSPWGGFLRKSLCHLCIVFVFIFSAASIGWNYPQVYSQKQVVVCPGCVSRSACHNKKEALKLVKIKLVGIENDGIFCIQDSLESRKMCVDDVDPTHMKYYQPANEKCQWQTKWRVWHKNKSNPRSNQIRPNTTQLIQHNSVGPTWRIKCQKP
jgi:hypothetical protein